MGTLLGGVLLCFIGAGSAGQSFAENNHLAVPLPPAGSSAAKLKRLLPSSHYQLVDPILSLEGNLGSTNGLKLANMAASKDGKPSAGLSSNEVSPFFILITNEQEFAKVWNLAGASVLASEPVSRPNIDFSLHNAVFVVPYKSRSGGKPPTLRNISFNMKKLFLLLEFDEDDLFKVEAKQEGHITSSAIGNPWYLGVFDREYFQKPPVVNVRDW